MIKVLRKNFFLSFFIFSLPCASNTSPLLSLFSNQWGPIFLILIKLLSVKELNNLNKVLINLENSDLQPFLFKKYAQQSFLAKNILDCIYDTSENNHIPQQSTDNNFYSNNFTMTKDSESGVIYFIKRTQLDKIAENIKANSGRLGNIDKISMDFGGIGPSSIDHYIDNAFQTEAVQYSLNNEINFDIYSHTAWPWMKIKPKYLTPLKWNNDEDNKILECIMENRISRPKKENESSSIPNLNSIKI